MGNPVEDAENPANPLAGPQGWSGDGLARSLRVGTESSGAQEGNGERVEGWGEILRKGNPRKMNQIEVRQV